MIEETLPAAIGARIRDNLPGWYGPDARLAGEPELQERNWSYFIRYQVWASEAECKTILVKIRHPQGMGLAAAASDGLMRQEAQQEHRELAAIERALGEDSRFCAVRSLACFEEWSALVMEELDCRPLKVFLQKPWLAYREPDWRSFITMLGHAARWLRLYHERAGAVVNGPYFEKDTYNAACEHLQTISASHRALNLLTFQQALAVLHRSHAGASLPHARRHGDFNLANIIFTPDSRVGALDPAGRPGTIYADLAKLVADLQTRAAQVLTFGRFIPPGKMQELIRTLVNGYFGSQAFDETALDLYCLLAVIEKWETDVSTASALSGKKRFVNALMARARRKYFMQLMGRYVKRIDGNAAG